MNFQRYLSAKRTVDDRALNRRVADRLAEEIAARNGDRLRVLEVGAGTGATVDRLLDAAWLPDRVEYTALDVRPENLATARERLPPKAAARGHAVRTRGDRLAFERDGRRVAVELVAADAFAFLADADRAWDLVVAHAFADLVDPDDAHAAFRDALAPDGVVYCPITYDGHTAFEPVADREFDDRLLAAFHRHLDESGDSRAGRHLLARTAENGELLAAGSSDWIVRPRDGGYPADERYFLTAIVDLIGGAARQRPELDDGRVDDWLSRRRDRIADAELVYCTHQLDLLFQ